MANRDDNTIPLVGHTFEINFGDVVFHNTFESEDRLTYRPIKGGLGVTQTVSYSQVEIRPNAYFQFWQEEDGTTVARFIDFAEEVVYATITLPGLRFLTPKGTVTRVE